jgi:hypothetical protein
MKCYSKCSSRPIIFTIKNVTINKKITISGRSCSDDFQPSERRNQNLGLDWRQTGDGHQHRLLLPTPFRRARRRTIHCRWEHF